MSSERKSRSEISNEKADTKKELGDELTKQESHQRDAEIAAKAMADLKSAGTAEGDSIRQKAAADAENAIKQEASRLEQAEGKVSDSGKTLESKLESVSKDTKDDKQKAESAGREVKFEGAKRSLEAIVKASSEDADFIDKTVDERKETRTDADDRTKKFVSRINSLRVKLGG